MFSLTRADGNRLLRGGVGPDLHHIVYVVGSAAQAGGHNRPIKGSCIDGHGDRCGMVIMIMNMLMLHRLR